MIPKHLNEDAFERVDRLDRVKSSMGISSKDFDDELLRMIDACRLDMQLAGIYWSDPNDVLIEQAIKLYCKAFFRNDEKSENNEKAYTRLKCALSLMDFYKENKENGNA